jgi:hypothetical protein
VAFDVLIVTSDGVTHRLPEDHATLLAENLRARPRHRELCIPAADKLEQALVEGQHAAPVTFTTDEAVSVARALEANIVADPKNAELRALYDALMNA